MDNKKIIIFIIGLSLIIIGLIGWSCFDRANNQNKKITEESAVYDEGVNSGVNRGVNKGVNKGVNSGVTADDAQSAAENTSSAEHVQKKQTGKIFSKVSLHKTSAKTSNSVNQEESETVVLSETVVKDNELEDPYVDTDGSVVVRNEFKPNVREKIPYRGVVYTIKTKLAETAKD